MFDLINIFEVFLPQLLLYPNPSDPLNIDAATLLNKNAENYTKRVKEYVNKYASANIRMDDDESEEESEGEMSDMDDDINMVGDMEL